MDNMIQGYIYLLKSPNTNKVYVGSTTNKERRYWGHTNDYKYYLEGKCHYKKSFDIVECGDCYMEVYKVILYNNKKTLLEEEEKVIRELDCINTKHAKRSIKEWRADNKQHEINYRKEYYKKNKTRINARNKEKVKCELCGKMSARVHLRRHQRGTNCIKK